MCGVVRRQKKITGKLITDELIRIKRTSGLPAF